MSWRNASRAHPCSICERPDWCRHEPDACITDCYRACGPGGVPNRDKIGQTFWRHHPTGTPGSSSSTGSGGAPGGHEPEADDGATGIAYEHERADADTLHAVYSDLIALLPLYDDHGKRLRDERRLTPEEVHVLGYRSFPDKLDAQKVVDQLVEKHGIAKLLTVPGFDRPERHVDMVDRTNGEVIKLDATEMRLSGAPGILLPQRDAQGRIVGMMLRLDDPPNPDPGRTYTRYLPLTSYTYTGCAAAIGVHVPLHRPDADRKAARIVEGIFKADIATLRTGILTMGIQSGGRWVQGIRVAEELGAEELRLAPDADTRENMGICSTLTFAANGLEARGGKFFLEVWPFTDKTLKGLDDVINEGKLAEVRVVSGVERWRTLKAWLASSGAPPDHQVAARILLDRVVESAERDPFSVFKPGIAEALAVLDAGSVEVQKLMSQIKEHLRGSWRDFQKKVTDGRARYSRAARTQQLKDVVQSGRHVFKRGDQVEARDALLDDLTPVGSTAFDHTLCVFDGGALYKLEDGVFTKLDEAALITKVAGLAGSPLTSGGVLSVSRNFAKGAVELAYDKRTEKNFFRDAPHGIAFKDIFVCVDPKTKSVREERLGREHRIRGRYEFEYIKGARPEKFLELLDSALDGKQDKTECIRVIQQFTGASIAGLAPRFQRAIIFRGKGNDAKSTIATILSAAMPKGTVSAVPPQSFGHPYSRAALDGMLLNCVSETPENDILDAGTLKAIITGDKIEARNPYERPFAIEPRAGQLFVLNNLFKVKDTSRAFVRRWILIDFENEVTNAERFKVEKVLEEVPAIVSWAIEGLRDLLAHDYAIPESSKAAVDEWLCESDTVQQYVEARLVPLTPEEKANEATKWPKGELVYADYRAWVRDNGHGQPMSSTRFFRRLGERLGLRRGKGAKEGHEADGNHYPVRFREFAEMVAKAREDERKNADLLKDFDGTASTPVLLSFQAVGAIFSGDLFAFIEQAGADGRLAVSIPNRGAATLLVPARGEDEVRSYVASIADERLRTIVTFVEKSVEGRLVPEVVSLRRPEPAGVRPN